MSIISLHKAEASLREQPREINKALRRLLLPFGGSDFFFIGGEKPLFLLDLTLPAEMEAGVNFDIRLAYGMVNLARDCGTEEIRFGVKTAEGFDFATVLEKSGYQRLAEMDGVRFLDLRQSEMLSRITDTGLVLDEAGFYRPVLEADVIISLAKFKAAEDQLFGSAMRNVLLAAELPTVMDFVHRERALTDVYSVLSPDLTIVDGLRGDSGFQPQKGDFLLAAVDAVAADAVLCALAGIDLATVESLQLAAQYGLGIGEPSDIRLYGDDMSELML